MWRPATLAVVLLCLGGCQTPFRPPLGGAHPCSAASAIWRSASLNLLAQIPAPPVELLGKFMWGAIGALGIASLILTVIVQYKKAFGAQPPLNEVLAGLAKAENIVEVKKEVEDVRSESHLRARGLEEQISKVRHEKTSDYQALTSIGDERERRLMEKLDENFRTVTKERSVSTGRLHDRLEATAKTLREEIDSKLNDLRKEINELPTRIITTLRDTGAIGKGRGQ